MSAHPRRALGVMAVTQFLLEVQFWFPLWLIFLLHLGFDLTTAVIADGVFRLVSVAAEIPMGLLADRIGRRASYLLTCALSALTFTGIAFVSQQWHLFAVWVLWGVLWALNSGASTAYAYELAHQLPGAAGARGFAVVRGVGQAAVLVSLVSAGWLYDLDPRWPFLVTAALAALAGLLALGLPDTAPPGQRHATGAALRGAREALGSPAVRATAIVTALFMLHGWSARILFQPLALDLGLDPAATGWMYAGVAAVGMAAALAIGWVRGGHRPIVVALGAMLTVVACAAIWLRPEWGPVVWLPLLSLGWGAGWTTLELELAGRVDPRLRATMLSLVSCVAGLGIAVARPGLGALADAAGSAVAFGVWAAVGVVVLAAMAVPLRRLRESRS